MHFPVKVIRQSSVIVEPRQVRATDIADLQLLVSRRARRVRQLLELALALLLGVLGLAQLEELGVRLVDQPAL